MYNNTSVTSSVNTSCGSYSSTTITSCIENSKTKFIPSFVTPQAWYRIFTNKRGVPDMPLMAILSYIVYWNRPNKSKDPKTGDVIYVNKFFGDTWQTSYKHLEDQFNFNREKIRKIFVKLESMGICKRDPRTIHVRGQRYNNRLFIHLNLDFLNACLQEIDTEEKFKTRLKDSSKEEIVKSFKAVIKLEPKEKITQDIGNTSQEEFEVNPIESSIDCIKSDKNNSVDLFFTRNEGGSPRFEGDQDQVKNTKYSKDRSTFDNFKIFDSSDCDCENQISDEVEIRSNFLKNSSEEKKKEKTASVVNVDKNDKSSLKNSSEEKLPFQTKSRFNSFGSTKSLDDFLPISQEDCYQLQSSSGREFCLVAMNEILQDIAKRKPEWSSGSKKGFMSYATKVFQYEKRDVVKTNNVNFRIKANYTSEENKGAAVEKYLSEIEYSQEVSPTAHLRKKLAAVLEPNKAFSLLNAYKKMEITDDVATIELTKQVELTQNDKDIILNQIRATHDSKVTVKKNNTRSEEVEHVDFTKCKENLDDGKCSDYDFNKTFYSEKSTEDGGGRSDQKLDEYITCPETIRELKIVYTKAQTKISSSDASNASDVKLSLMPNLPSERSKFRDGLLDYLSNDQVANWFNPLDVNFDESNNKLILTGSAFIIDSIYQNFEKAIEHSVVKDQISLELHYAKDRSRSIIYKLEKIEERLKNQTRGNAFNSGSF